MYKNSQDEYLFRFEELVVIVFDFFDGKAFLELNTSPTSQQLEQVIIQAFMINKTDLRPVFYYDMWAVPNVAALFTKLRPLLDEDDIRLIDKVIARFSKINLDELPHCLVHGDLTKGNVMLDKNGNISIIDFSVTNWAPRIIELILIISNLMFDENDNRTLQQKVDIVAGIYQKYNTLSSDEIASLYDLSLLSSAMELLGSCWQQKVLGDNSDETLYWQNLGRIGLRRELPLFKE